MPLEISLRDIEHPLPPAPIPKPHTASPATATLTLRREAGAGRMPAAASKLRAECLTRATARLGG